MKAHKIHIKSLLISGFDYEKGFEATYIIIIGVRNMEFIS